MSTPLPLGLQAQIAAPPAAEAPAPDTQAEVRDVSLTDSLTCAACATAHAADAAFCVECGHPLGTACPACGAPGEGCDFCQSCGHWLRPGQCRFCYAPLAEGARFCEDCGCNQQGLHCAGCGQTSFFDFCSGCGQPLSERAQGAMQAPPPDPALAAGLQAVREAMAELAALAPDPAAQQATSAAAPPPLGTRGRLISEAARRGLREAAAGIDQALRAAGDRAVAAAQAEREAQAARQAQAAAQAREAAEQAERRNEVAALQARRLTLSAQLRAARERAQALVAASQGQTYPDGQSARCAGMKLRLLLTEVGQVPTGWRCVAFDVRHPSPNECGKPEIGGTWLFD